MSEQAKRISYLILGWLFIVLAFIGLFLPLLPTTPFVLLSAYLFSKSSEKLHQWLLQQKTFGPLINNWQNYGVINRKSKILSTALIIPLFSYTLIFIPVSLVIKIIVTTIGALVLTFIWSRPSCPKS